MAATLAAANLLWAGAASATPRWTTVSAGFRVTLSKEDIVVTRDGRRVFSARQAARADHNQSVRDGEGAAVWSERTFTLLAVAGPYLSLRDESYINVVPSAHPGGETRFWTIDLRRAGRPGGSLAARAIDLKRLVGSAPLAQALAADPFVRGTGAGKSASLGAIQDALAAATSADPKRCYEVPDDWTSRFAIRGWDGARLRVRLGLPGSGPCRYALTQLALTIATSPVVRKAIGPAKTPAAYRVMVRFGPRTAPQ